MGSVKTPSVVFTIMFQLAMQMLLLICLISSNVVRGYGGWGPGEDYGHTGVDPPTNSINAIYGYDFTGTKQKLYSKHQHFDLKNRKQPGETSEGSKFVTAFYYPKNDAT